MNLRIYAEYVQLMKKYNRLVTFKGLMLLKQLSTNK